MASSQSCVRCIGDLPKEVLEKIFKILLSSGAGCSFLRCRAVCKLWKDTAENGVLKNINLSEKIWFKVCSTSVPRNTALEFLNIGPSRFRGSDVDRTTELSKDESIFPQDFTLHKLHKIDSNNTELRYEDGSSLEKISKWRRLFYRCFVLAAKNESDGGIESVKQESLNFRTRSLDSVSVTSLKISGQVIISGHSSGTLRFWTLAGNYLDSILAMSRTMSRNSVQSLSLIDAYRQGKYITQDIEGRHIYTDHHAVAVVSSVGHLILCALRMAGNSAQSRVRLIFGTRRIKCASTYGDLILAADYQDQICVIRLSTDNKYRSNPAQPPVISQSYVFSLSGKHILNCNIWNIPGSRSWSGYSITFMNHTGAIVRGFVPNKVTVVEPEWRKYARLDEQVENRNKEETLLFGRKNLFHVPSTISWEYQTLHIIESRENLVQTGSVSINEKSFEGTFGWNSLRMVQIEELEYFVLPYENTCEALGVERTQKIKRYDVFESCSIFRDDVFIIITRITKQMLTSVDGFYYKAYCPMKLQSFYGSYITTTYYTSNVLILGLSNGDVRAYNAPGKSGLLNLNLDKPAWTAKPSKWSIGSPVTHIHVGMSQEFPGMRNDAHLDCGKVVIVASHEDNSITVIKRSLTFV